LLALLLCAAAPAAPPGVAACALTFDDEFDRFVSSPDGHIGWMTAYPYGGESARALPTNGEAEFYSDASAGPNPFSVRDGILTISATPARPGSNPYGLPYISGLITTFHSFAQAYGYFEVRARLPAGSGLWPAFWMLQHSIGYDAELDIFEVLGKTPSKLYATTHWLTDGSWHALSQALDVADTSAAFHTYGVDWEPERIAFYVDGQVIATAGNPPTMTRPMYLLLNLAVGKPGSWPDAPNAATRFPARMDIDYVRAFATRNTVGVTGTAARRTGAPCP
jgi:beta-glucanase (GH16 family)